MLVVITLIYLFFIFTDAVPLVKGKQRKVLAIFSTVMVISFILFILSLKDVIKPDIITGIMKLVQMVYGDPRGSFVNE